MAHVGPILYLKRHNIPVTKPNDTAVFNLVRGVLKWAFLKTCVVNGTHATKTSTVLNALKKAIVASPSSLMTWRGALLRARQQPPRGEANGVARADSCNFEDVFQEADTLELAPPLGKPEPDIKDSANHYAKFKRFLEDETMNMIEFVSSLELKCSWTWKVAKIMSNFMQSFIARAKPPNDLRAVLQDLYESLEMFVPVDFMFFADLVKEIVFEAPTSPLPSVSLRLAKLCSRTPISYRVSEMRESISHGSHWNP